MKLIINILLLLAIQSACYGADAKKWYDDEWYEDDEELRSTPAWKLMIAISDRNAGQALKLIADGAPVDTVIAGTTPLYDAAEKLCPVVVDRLLRKGALVNQTSCWKWNKNGETALGVLMTRSGYARNSRISFGCIQMIVDSLIKFGADPMLKGENDLRPIDKIATEVAVPNKAALPIIISLLRVSVTNKEYEQSKQVAGDHARQQATKVRDICLDHYAMLNARAQFIETYQNDVTLVPYNAEDERYYDILSFDCDKDHPEMIFF